MQCNNKKLKKLKKKISYHAYRYYTLDNPIISDIEYDLLIQKLQKLEKKSKNFQKNDSITKKIGLKMLNFFKIKKHFTPMLSLQNIYNVEEIEVFKKKIQKKIKKKVFSLSCELKIDGLAISLLYKKGILIRSLTRGNGIKGEDVTLNSFNIKNIPKFLNSKYQIPEIIEIRGEIYMLSSDFKKLNQKKNISCNTIFSNSRNAAAGSLRQNDPKITKERKLMFFCHGYGICKMKNIPNNHYDMIKKIKSWGIPVNKNIFLTNKINEIQKYYFYFQKKRDLLNFEIDGIVVKINDLNDQKKIGNTTKYPKWAIAIKFSPYEKQTKILNVDFQVGRTGIITPVARLKPIKISGVIIKNASLHNRYEIKRLKILIGSTVLIRRAGDVIPYVVKVVNTIDKNFLKTKKIIFPQNCPSCNTKIIEENNMKISRCNNYFNCIEQLKKKLEHFVSRNAFNIIGLGPNIIHKLFSNKIVLIPSDFFKLTAQNLKNIEGIKEKKANNIIQSLNIAKKISLEKFIYSLGIHGVGISVSKYLSKNYINIQNFINANLKDLLKINKIGKNIANNIISFLKNKDSMLIILKLIKHVKFEKKNLFILKNKKNFFLNKKIVITGKLIKFTRNEINEILKKNGFIIQNIVSKNTDFLLCGKYTHKSKKLIKSKKLKVKILNENEFLILIKNII
ncbi:NAD-dependent DNA ligase LigA [Buchnera aphidicola (Kurisakia onigurumii)]|uniref:NAD-dependent DNA ligase LigA n=1 Tax=Buchnera aphidicola TaxID=9 RepID=UPI0031B6BD66